jgi:hypothetical protein
MILENFVEEPRFFKALNRKSRVAAAWARAKE